MKNLGLYQKMYVENIKPWIRQNYPLLTDKIAVGMLECEQNGLSWKCSYYLWLSDQDYDYFGKSLNDSLQKVMLIPEAANASIIVTSVEQFLNQWFGIKKEQLKSLITQREWEQFSKKMLYAFAKGIILEDPEGDITMVHDQLGYYPDEIRRKLISHYWEQLDRINEVIYCHSCGNRIGEKVALNQLMESILHLTYLYNKIYDPIDAGVVAYQLRDLEVVGKEIESFMIRCYNSAFIDEIMISFQSMISVLRKEDERQKIGSDTVNLNVLNNACVM